MKSFAPIKRPVFNGAGIGMKPCHSFVFLWPAWPAVTGTRPLILRAPNATACAIRRMDIPRI